MDIRITEQPLNNNIGARIVFNVAYPQNDIAFPHNESLPSLNSEDSADSAVFYALFYSACCVLGTLGNAGASCYFWSEQCKMSSFFTKLYRAITATDLIISLLAPLLILSQFQMGGISQIFVLCQVFAYTWNFLIFIHIFLVVAMTIARAVSIAVPEQTLRKKHLMGLLAGYISCLLALFFLLLAQDRLETVYSKDTGTCQLNIQVTESRYFIKTVYLVTFFIVPFVAVAGGSLVTVCVLVSRLSVTGKSGQSRNNRWRNCKTRSSITILLFGALFLATHTPSIVYILWGMIVKAENHAEQAAARLHLLKYSEVGTVLLNAALNPILYCWRMGKMRNYLIDLPKRYNNTSSTKVRDRTIMSIE